jgi:hypothetical protein
MPRTHREEHCAPIASAGCGRHTGRARRRTPIGKAALRVTFWGSQAMLLTALVGRMFGTWLSPLYLSPYHHISSILLVKRTFHG